MNFVIRKGFAFRNKLIVDFKLVLFVKYCWKKNILKVFKIGGFYLWKKNLENEISNLNLEGC